MDGSGVMLSLSNAPLPVINIGSEMKSVAVGKNMLLLSVIDAVAVTGCALCTWLCRVCHMTPKQAVACLSLQAAG